MRPSEALAQYRTRIREIALSHRVTGVRVFSAAMRDAVTWIGTRLSEIEDNVAAHAGLTDDFHIDAHNVDMFVDALWNNAIEHGGAAGAPDLPLVDGIPYRLRDEDDEDELGGDDLGGDDEFNDYDEYVVDEYEDDEDSEEDVDDWDEDFWEETSDEEDEPKFIGSDQTSLFDAEVLEGSNGPQSAADPAETTAPSEPGGPAASAGPDYFSTMSDEEWARYNAFKDLWDEEEIGEDEPA